jgi:hypothetical protein
MFAISSRGVSVMFLSVMSCTVFLLLHDVRKRFIVHGVESA